MTYWPISSPSVFAASKETRTQPTPVSHDGADEDDGQGGVQHAEDDMAGEMVAMEVTRSGHLFATITRSTLTIWQTKAGCRCAAQQSGMR